MSINSTLYTAVSGLNAASYGINNASNNLANANVKGYSRRRVSFSSSGYRDTSKGTIGTGVKVDSVSRIKDMYLDGQIRTNNSKLNTESAQLSSLQMVESIINEPSDVSVSAYMSEMFNSFDELASDPTSAPHIENVLQRAEMFTDNVNALSESLDSIEADNAAVEAQYVQVAEDLIADLTSLNAQIASVTAGGTTPNELLDQRDIFLNQLSEYADLDVTINSDETFTVDVKTTSGNSTVIGTGAVTLTSIKDSLTDGKIKGVQDVNIKVASYGAKLDSFVETLATDMNAIHSTNGGGTMFSFTAGDAGNTITVDADLMNGTRRLNVGDPLKSGDGSLARSQADLRSGNMSNGKVAQEEYNELLVTLGTDINHLNNKTDSRSAILEQLETRKESISGVSIDEETVDLMNYQQSYEANAKVMNIVQEMMDTLLGLFR